MCKFIFFRAQVGQYLKSYNSIYLRKNIIIKSYIFKDLNNYFNYEYIFFCTKLNFFINFLGKSGAVF